MILFLALVLTLIALLKFKPLTNGSALFKGVVLIVIATYSKYQLNIFDNVYGITLVLSVGILVHMFLAQRKNKV